MLEDFVVDRVAGRNEVHLLPDFVRDDSELAGITVELLLSLCHTSGKVRDDLGNVSRHLDSGEQKSRSVRLES